MVLFFLPSWCLAIENSVPTKLDLYLEYFYNRYSQHFDLIGGLKYQSPSYGIVEFKLAETAREIMSLAGYYKYRSLAGDAMATRILKEAITESYANLLDKPASRYSFEDAEAMFLLVQLIESSPHKDIKSEAEKIKSLIALKIETAILANDTENRALVAGAHWQYLADYITRHGWFDKTTKEKIDKLIKDKIDLATRDCIDKDFWYRENKWRSFSPHYQAVSAFMLMNYGHITGQEKYLEIAKKMYYNLKKISFHNGMVEAKLGNRPLGLGEQFYLMQGLLGKYFQDTDYQVYLFYGNGNRFFSDQSYPNRLEFHSTIEDSKSTFHDDYAFIDAAEMALTNERLSSIENQTTYFKNPIKKSTDKFFRIINNGRSIIINGRRNVLGSYGNWSHLY